MTCPGQQAAQAARGNRTALIVAGSLAVATWLLLRRRGRR